MKMQIFFSLVMLLIAKSVNGMGFSDLDNKLAEVPELYELVVSPIRGIYRSLEIGHKKSWLT